MIFRRTKRSPEPSEDAAAPAEDERDESVGDERDESADAEAGDPAADEAVERDPEEIWAELDALDWRTDGPFDATEVDEPESTPEAPTIDLGALVLTGFPGAELRLQLAEDTQQIVSALLIHADSALELGAYAAPRSGGLWVELREEIMEGTVAGGGSAELAEGPFGVELRRIVPVTTPDGQQGYQPSRMWVAEGPRWLLRGIVYGQAAVVETDEGPTAQLLEAFRRVVVRRGDEAMAPGDLLPLSMPQDLTPAPAG